MGVLEVTRAEYAEWVDAMQSTGLNMQKESMQDYDDVSQRLTVAMSLALVERWEPACRLARTVIGQVDAEDFLARLETCRGRAEADEAVNDMGAVFYEWLYSLATLDVDLAERQALRCLSLMQTGELEARDVHLFWVNRFLVAHYYMMGRVEDSYRHLLPMADLYVKWSEDEEDGLGYEVEAVIECDMDKEMKIERVLATIYNYFLRKND